jgi:hypothetical protein
MAVRRSKLLLGRVAGDDESDVRVSRTDLHSNDYHIVAADFTDTTSLEAKLTTDCGLVRELKGFLHDKRKSCRSISRDFARQDFLLSCT